MKRILFITIATLISVLGFSQDNDKKSPFSFSGYLHIRVRRLLADWELRRDLVSAVRILERKDMAFIIRLFGVGGLFGYFGLFRNSSLGNFRMLGTRRNKALLIETITAKKIVITPDDPQELIDYFNTFK